MKEKQFTISVWEDRDSEPGEPKWIVSLDTTHTTHTIDVLDTREEALISARSEGARRRLPIYEMDQAGNLAWITVEAPVLKGE